MSSWREFFRELRKGRRFYLELFFRGEVPWKDLVAFTKSMDREAEQVTGSPFYLVEVGTNSNYGPGKRYREKEYEAAAFFQNPPPPPVYPLWPRIWAYSLNDVTEDIPFIKKSFSVNYWPPFPIGEPDYPTTSLRIEIEFFTTSPANTSSAHLAMLMKKMTCFVAEAGCQVTYGYVWHMIGIRERPYADGLIKRQIPDHKLMGIRWANVITQQQLGKHPTKLLADISRCIHPQQIEEVASGIYFFRLPLALLALNADNQALLDEQINRVLEVVRPHKVLYMNGRRRHYH